MNGRRSRGATARTAARRIAAGTRLRGAPSGAARRDTGAQGAPVGAQAESDAHVTLAVAEALEMAASRIRQNGLAWFASRLAHVARQPNPLTPMPSKDPRDALMTAKDVAGLLNVDIRTLRRLRHLGDVPKPITVGRVLRWRRRDIARWLEGGK